MNYIESSMDFSPLFKCAKTIYLERSKYYKSFSGNIRSVEFITMQKHNKLIFIEGKSSSPKPDQNNKHKMKEFMDPIIEKFLHSYHLFLSTMLHINIDIYNEFPKCMFENYKSDTKIVFLLILNGHEEKWLMPILDYLHRSLIAIKKIWKIEIAVWNDEIARKHNFVA
jgi:hypothetical protein